MASDWIGSLSPAIGAGLAVAVAPLHASVATGLGIMVSRVIHGGFFEHLGTTGALGLTLATDVAFAIIVSIGATAIRTLKVRRHHRQILDLVSVPRSEMPDVVSLNHATAMAYCLPGLRPRIVFSSGISTFSTASS